MFIFKRFSSAFLLIFASASFMLQAQTPFVSKKKIEQDKIVNVSIPKSGTHLLLKCISLFGIKKFSHNYENTPKPRPEHLKKIREINKNLPPNHYKGNLYIPVEGPLPKSIMPQLTSNTSRKLFFTHWPYTKEFDQVLQKNTFANFITIRDPRDMVVSFAFMVYKSREGKTADVSKIILDLITGNQQYYVPWAVEIHEAYPVLWEKGLYRFYEMYKPWINTKKFMLVKFENLIGPKGGGSYEQQLKTIMKISQHLGIPLSLQKIQTVIADLFGGTWTFREGQIGGWKKYFTPEIKKAFKQDPRLIQLLIDLGYENGSNW